MKSITTLILGAVFMLGSDLNAADPKPLSSQKERASYGVGMNVGKRFRHELIDLDIEAFARGFRDALNDAKPALTEAELDEAMASLRKDVEQKAGEQATKNK